MPADRQNELEREPVQTPGEQGATELPELSEDQIAGMSKEQLVDYYANARNAIASATKRNQELAEQRKAFDAERAQFQEAYEQRQRELEEQRQKFYDHLQNIATPASPTPQQATPPAFEEDPAAAFKSMQKMVEEVRNNYDEFKNKTEQEKDAMRQEFQTALGTMMWEGMLKDQIYSNPDYKHVTKHDLKVWFEEHPNTPPDPKYVHAAAKDIESRKVNEFENYIKEKEKLARQATVQTKGNLGTLPPEKGFMFKDIDEQARIMEEDARRLGLIE